MKKQRGWEIIKQRLSRSSGNGKERVNLRDFSKDVMR
jgi:hypothetical protein